MQFEVTEKAMRPASKKRECFYCKQPVGSLHTKECVLVVKKWKVKVEIEIEGKYPDSWGVEDVWFHLNSGSYCASNVIGIISEMSDKEGCICNRTNFSPIQSIGEPFVDE